MKKSIFLLLSLLVCAFAQSQTNESNPSLYEWKGKKTILQKGYVVLKSGKKLEGKISLQGNSSNVKGVKFVGDGKDIDFPMTALNAYGLAGSNGVTLQTGNVMVCDNNEELFSWRSQGEVMGKQIANTKPRNGYIVTQDGHRVEGELQLKKVDGVIAEVRLKNASGKNKYKPSQVARYGLAMTIGELTKNGEKVYKDEARNFHEGSIALASGETVKGWVAFKDRNYINPNKPSVGFKYNGLFFAASQSAIAKTYSDQEVDVIVQKINGSDLKYSPFEGGFVAENAMDNARFRDDLKKFNPGTLTLSDGTKLTGDIAKVKIKSVNFRSADGKIKSYPADAVNRFDVMVEGKPKAVIQIDGHLAEEYFKGNNFWVYENPLPTTVNKKKTELARSAVSLGTSSAAAMVISKDEKKQGYETNLDSLVMVSSVAELKDYKNAMLRLNGVETSEQLQDSDANETAKKYDAALGLAIAGKEAREGIVVYYKETILTNLSSGEKVVLYKQKKALSTKLEGWLMGCYTFLGMDKKQQKKYYQFDQLVETAKMLDECY